MSPRRWLSLPNLYLFSIKCVFFFIDLFDSGLVDALDVKEFVDMLAKKKAKQSFIEWDEYQLMVASKKLSQESLTVMTKFFDDSGILIWFDKPSVRSLVILDPQSLATIFRTIVSFAVSWTNG